MYQPTLPARPRPPALAPLSRAQTILLDGTYRGELDEVMARLPAFDRVPFAAPGGIDNGFLDAIVRREEPGRGLPAVPVAVVSSWPPVKGAVSRSRCDRRAGGFPRDMQAEAQLTTYGARMALQVRLPRELDFDPGDGHPLALRLVCLNSVDGLISPTGRCACCSAGTASSAPTASWSERPAANGASCTAKA